MYLGLDLGTSGLKGILISEDQEVVGTAEQNYPVQNLSKGWSEQNPNDWLDACEKVINLLASRYSSQISNLKGIGISGHMHGATLLDNRDSVIRPCILWNDTRAYLEAKNMDAFPSFREISGNIVFPGFTAPKVAWVEKNEPENFRRISTILLPKDYVRLWLTGDLISEMSDAAGTSWLDLHNRCWSKKLLSLSRLDLGQMPRLIEGSEVGGALRAELRRRWNIRRDVVVAGGGGDNASAACGSGVIFEGQGFISLGTSGVLLVARDNCVPSPETAIHTFCHAIPNRWYQMGVILAATDALNWLSKISNKTVLELSSQLAMDPYGPSDLKFAPYLAGERTPHNDPFTRGAFIGLDISHSISDLTQAVFEGVAFALKDSLLALNKTGARVDKLFAMGGGIHSRFWLKTIATVLNIPLSVPKKGNLGAALGASRLAIVAAESSDVSDVINAPMIEETIDPEPNLVDGYEDAYKVFSKIYPKIKVLK